MDHPAAEIGSFQEDWIDTMAADALAPCIIPKSP